VSPNIAIIRSLTPDETATIDSLEALYQEDTMSTRNFYVNLTSYEETLHSWYDHYQVWQNNINNHDAYVAYIAAVEDMVLELDTDPTLPAEGITSVMLEYCCMNYSRNPNSENFAIMSGMMLYHQHKEFDKAEF
jgi:hypothetical protein